MSIALFIACSLVLLLASFSGVFLQYCALLNVLAFLTVCLDKFKSTYNFYRIRETDFYMMFLFGGWIGGLFAMIMFRHKTSKISFLIKATVASVASIAFFVKIMGFIWGLKYIHVSIIGCSIGFVDEINNGESDGPWYTWISLRHIPWGQCNDAGVMTINSTYLQYACKHTHMALNNNVVK